GRARREPANICTEDRDGGGSDPWNPESLAKCVGLNLPQPLHDLTRQTGHALKRKIRWDAAPFVAPRSLDLALLSLEVAGVLHGRVGAGDVRGRLSVIECEFRNMARRDKVDEPGLWLPEQVTR